MTIERAQSYTKEEAQGLWVLVEAHGEPVPAVTYEAFGAAQSVASGLGQRVCALVLGRDADRVTSLVEPFVDCVYTVNLPSDDSSSEVWAAKAAEWAIVQHKPSVVLAGATVAGKALLATVAPLLGTGLVNDCVDLSFDVERGALVFSRTVFAGNVIQDIDFPAAVRPQLATVRPKAFEPAKETGGSAEVIEVDIALADQVKAGSMIEETVREASGMMKLEEADIIVSGGRGLGDPDSFEVLKKLAEALGGALGASRAAVDAGWIPYKHQVGQTGKTVAPRVYVACGISGAIQHLAGMKSADIIVAINKNPEAPIFKVATYGIVGDLFEVAPLLTEELNRLAR